MEFLRRLDSIFTILNKGGSDQDMLPNMVYNAYVKTWIAVNILT